MVYRLNNRKRGFNGDDEALAIYLRKIRRYLPLSGKEEKKLAPRISNGDGKALEKLVNHNLRFVVTVARNYQNQGLPLGDLINEGNFGLIKAAKRFDEKKNFKFISYGVWWIRQAILDAISKYSRIINIPKNVTNNKHKVGIIIKKLEQEYNRFPEPEEIADEMDGIDIKNINNAMRVNNRYISFDAPVKNKELKEGILYDIFIAEDQVLPDEEGRQYLLSNLVEELLETVNDAGKGIVTEREKEIVKLWFGVGEDTNFTLDQIGEKYSICKERARQVKDRALDKLKKSSKARGIFTHHKLNRKCSNSLQHNFC